ncbi:MAG: OsmC family protein [Gemmatimonadota bacterium]
MSDTRRVTLTWAGEGRSFRGGSGSSAPIAIDGSSAEGPSPMETLLLSVCGCMAIDIRDILGKGRVPVEGLVIEAAGDRAPDPPRRFTRIELDIRVRGPGQENLAKVERAVQLSRDRYCSVSHSLSPDIEVATRIHLE